MSSRTLPRFAWGVLLWNLAVVVWGAYVRASGSGAGCGAHWPLCNGEVIPRAPTVERLIEFTHRATSGLALLAVVALAAAVFRSRPAGHPARPPALWALGFMFLEAALGAALVLFRLVAENASMARALFMGAHLIVTFLLLASLARAAHFAGAPPTARRRPRGEDRLGLAVLGLLLLAGASGAVAALGDTLYPAGSLRQALAQDLSPATHLLVRLRVWHPALAALAASAVVLFSWRLVARNEGELGWARFAGSAALVQIALGVANVALLAPIPLQLAHLLTADLVWISVVLARAAAAAPARAA